MRVPEGLLDKQLVFDHALCHALFSRKKEVIDAVPDWTLEELIDYHWLLKSEMEHRGIAHQEFDDLDGVDVGKTTVQSIQNTASQISAKSIYLPAPHPQLIWEGKKKLIVKCRSYGGMLNRPLYFGDDENIYGVLKLTDVEPISLEEFEKLRPKHLVSDREKKQWWPDSNKLYAYKFEVLSRFQHPRPYQYHRGTQVFFPTPEWKSDSKQFTIAVDLDGTIADTDLTKPIPECFVDAKPKALAASSMRQLCDLASIIIYTGRDPRYYELTAKWLGKYDIPYDELILGKPVADMYIDDLAVSFEDNWPDVVGTAHAAAAIIDEEKQTPESLGPGGETAINVSPVPYAQAMRMVHTPYEAQKAWVDYTVEQGEIIVKASLPKANKPAARYYNLEELPKDFKRYDKVLVEEKFDGMDVMLNKEKVWSGRGLDKSSRVPYIREEIKKWPHESFTLHGQAMMYSDSSPMHRTLAIGFLNGQSPVEEGKNLKIWIFDIIELDGKDLSDMPMIERLQLLRKEFKGTEHLPIIGTDQFTVIPPNKLTQTCKEMSQIKGSEGAMIFDPQSRWNKDKSINFGWCLTGGDFIFTQRGFEQAQYIKIGSKLLSKDGKWHKVLKIFSRPMREDERLVDVKPLKASKSRLTATHLVLSHQIINNSSWVPAEFCDPENLVMPSPQFDFGEAPNELYFSYRGYRKTIQVNSDFLRFCGFWVAEGHTDPNGGVCLSQNDAELPKPLLEKYAKIIREVISADPHIGSYQGKRVLRFWDKPLCTWLVKNFRDKYGEKTVPFWLRNTDFQSFWESYEEGDGIHASDRLKGVVTSSNYLAGKICLILKSLGKDYSLSLSQPKKGKKAFKIQLLKESPHSHSCSYVKPVSTDGKDVLYDFQIEDEDSYVLPNMTVHNSKWKAQKELDVLVVKKERKEEGWRYLAAIGPLNQKQAAELPPDKIAEMKGKKWEILGHTHVTSLDVAEGDVVRVRALEVVRNDTYNYTFQNAVPMYQPEKDVPDGLDVAEQLSEQTLQKRDDVATQFIPTEPISPGGPLPTPEEITRVAKEDSEDAFQLEKSHAHDKCMRCSEKPIVDVLYAEGMGRVWLCDKHFQEWLKERGGPWFDAKPDDPNYDPSYTNEKDVCKVYKLTDGVAPTHWKEHYRKGTKLYDEAMKEVKKQLATDPDSGAQTFVPGRTTEGVRTTYPVGVEPSSNYGSPEGSTNLEKIKDVDTYNPRNIKDNRVLLDDHRITHAWWSTLCSGKPLVHDKATVKTLHDEIAREIEHRGMTHDSPLKPCGELNKADGAFTFAPGGVVGVPGMGGGEREPEPMENTFREKTPLQYVRADEDKFHMHMLFGQGKEALEQAVAWKVSMEKLLMSMGASNVKVFVDELWEDGLVFGTASAVVPNVDKQLWPPWVGHRADWHTGKPLRSERPPVIPTVDKQMPPEESTSHNPVTWSPSRGGGIVELANWNIRFLGTSGEKTFPRTDCDDEQCRTDKRLNASAIYSSSDTNLLLDLGSKELADKIRTKLDGVCITHAHHDHYDGLASLSKDVPIYMHRDTWKDLLEFEPTLAKELATREVHLYSSYNAVRIGNVKVRWIPVKHSIKVKTFGTRLDGKVLYTPDFLEIDDKWLENLDVWIIDGASLKRDIVREQDGEGYGHQSIFNSLKQAASAKVPMVVVTHIGHTGVKQEDMPKVLSDLALEAHYEGRLLQAVDGFTLPGTLNKADGELPEPKEGRPYPAQFYKGPTWLHSRAYTYIIHHHFPYGPKIDKEHQLMAGTAGDIEITGPPPREAGGQPPKDAIAAPRDPKEAEAYVARELGASFAKSDDLEKGVGGFREHWETRQDTGAGESLIGWTFLTFPWPKTKQFFAGTIKGMTTAKPPIPRAHSKKFPRGWLDVQGLRKPVILGGAGSAAERNRCGFYEILEEGTFEYGTQRRNLHEYFFHGKLLDGRFVIRLLKLASGSPRWLCFRPPDQKPMDPKKHADEGYWKLVGETEASVQSPGEEKKPLEGE